MKYGYFISDLWFVFVNFLFKIKKELLDVEWLSPANQIFAPAPPSSNQREVMRVEQHLRIVSILSCTSTPHHTQKPWEVTCVPKILSAVMCKVKGTARKIKKITMHVCFRSQLPIKTRGKTWKVQTKQNVTQKQNNHCPEEHSCRKEISPLWPHQRLNQVPESLSCLF